MKRVNKKGVSEIVAGVIMIAIVLATGVLVWGIVSNLVSKNLDNAESCFGNYGKVTLNNRYTCYNDTTGANELLFAISVADIDLDAVVVRISSPGGSTSFTINKSIQLTGLQSYGRLATVQVPSKNSGITYRATGIASAPDSIEIAPIVGGKQCDVSDSIKEIDLCSSLA